MKPDKSPSSNEPAPSRATDMASPMEGWTDRELVAEYQRTSDERVLEILFERLRDPIIQLAIRETQDNDVAEDVCQEICLFLWEKIPTLSLDCQMITYLRRPVLRLARRRAVRKRLERPPEGSDQRLASLVDETEADGHAQAEVVDRTIRQLPPKLREVVRMHWFKGLTLREIATATNMPLGTVCRRNQRALRRLKLLLKETPLIGTVAAGSNFLKKKVNKIGPKLP